MHLKQSETAKTDKSDYIFTLGAINDSFQSWEFSQLISDVERRFMYKNDQSYLVKFCINFWPGGPPLLVRIVAQVQWFVHQNQLVEPSSRFGC